MLDALTPPALLPVFFVPFDFEELAGACVAEVERDFGCAGRDCDATAI